MSAEVYFADFRVTYEENTLQKLDRLLDEAGLSKLDFKNKFVAIKIHFGEPGNLAYLRPNYAKVVVDFIRKRGGRPFLTDCNTLYVGRRKHALDHLDAAYENGYTPFSTGCHVIIADGLKGTDEELIPINKEYVKEAKIGKAIADADIIITLNHFKGHEATGFGGALKNIGMGCGSRAGKMEMHASGKPNVEKQLCISCGACRKNCAHDAIYFVEKKACIDHEKCVGCGRCIGVCPADAVQPGESSSNDILNKKIAEYSYAVLKEKPNFHINMVLDVSPFCDCHAESDAPVIPDVGMFASFDPVAIDQACADAVNHTPTLSGTVMDERELMTGENGEPDHFCSIHPTTNWAVGLDHAQKLGIGTREYKLLDISKKG